MQKSILFIIAITFGILLVYSIWYYSNIGKYQRGIVVWASELKQTRIGEDGTPDGNRNFIYSTGLKQAKGLANSEVNFPDSNRLFANAVLNKQLLHNLNTEISRKFPSHPPISFPAAKIGD